MSEVARWSEEELGSLTAEAAGDVVKILPALFDQLSRSVMGIVNGSVEKDSVAKVRRLIEVSLEKAGAMSALGEGQRSILKALENLGA